MLATSLAAAFLDASYLSGPHISRISQLRQIDDDNESGTHGRHHSLHTLVAPER